MFSQAHADGLFGYGSNTKEPPHSPVSLNPIKREQSDLELSSLVEKAEIQVTERTARFWGSEDHVALRERAESFTAIMDYHQQQQLQPQDALDVQPVRSLSAPTSAASPQNLPNRF